MNISSIALITLMYQMVYQKRTSDSWIEKTALKLLKGLTGTAFADEVPERNKIKIAIIGAGSIGAMLADELRCGKVQINP